jgi:hypothetical protein
MVKSVGMHLDCRGDFLVVRRHVHVDGETIMLPALEGTHNQDQVVVNQLSDEQTF